MSDRTEVLHKAMDVNAEHRFPSEPGGHTGRTSANDKQIAYKWGFLAGVDLYRSLSPAQWAQEKWDLVDAFTQANLDNACEEFDKEEAAEVAMYALGFRRVAPAESAS